MVPILFIITFLVLSAILIWAFASFFQLVKVEIKDFPDEWDKDGQPFGAYLNRSGTRSYVRSGVASQWTMMFWLVKKPKWVQRSNLASALLWQYRALVLVFNVGIICWFVILFFALIVP